MSESTVTTGLPPRGAHFLTDDMFAPTAWNHTAADEALMRDALALDVTVADAIDVLTAAGWPTGPIPPAEPFTVIHGALHRMTCRAAQASPPVGWVCTTPVAAGRVARWTCQCVTGLRGWAHALIYVTGWAAAVRALAAGTVTAATISHLLDDVTGVTPTSRHFVSATPDAKPGVEALLAARNATISQLLDARTASCRPAGRLPARLAFRTPSHAVGRTLIAAAGTQVHALPSDLWAASVPMVGIASLPARPTDIASAVETVTVGPSTSLQTLLVADRLTARRNLSWADAVAVAESVATSPVRIPAAA